MDYVYSYSYTYEHKDLSRVSALLAKLGDPHRSLRFVHVAGTNGKGSTCAMLSSILQHAGYRTGLFTSPHILRYNERMQINGNPIPDDELITVTERVKEAIDSMEDKVNWFEMMMCSALLWFSIKKAEIIVFEVGLGGLLDATNVIDPPECAVITNIGLDHTAILGNTLEEIAFQKAGIVKHGSPVVIYRSTRSVEEVIEKKCLEVGAPIIKTDFDSITTSDEDLFGQTFSAEGMSDLYIPLVGDHQKKNTCVVIKTVRALRERGWSITDEDIRCGLKDTVWPVRFEVVSKDPLFVIDGGHNPQCAAAVVDTLRSLLPPDMRVVFLTGILADKDYMEIIRILSSVSKEFVTVTPDSYRALSSDQLASSLRSLSLNVSSCSTVEEGIETAISLANGGMVCCVGSLYLAGEVRRHFSADTSLKRLV